MAALAPTISRPKPGTPRNFTESLTEKDAALMLINRAVRHTEKEQENTNMLAFKGQTRHAHLQ